MGKKSGAAASGYWAPNADESEKGGPRDKKFEGYSNLKGSHELEKKRGNRQKDSEVAKHLEEEYILNMQR